MTTTRADPGTGCGICLLRTACRRCRRDQGRGLDQVGVAGLASARVGQDIEDLLDRIPMLRGRPRAVERLPGGLTNTNVKVTLPDGSRVVARISTTDSALLAIDR